MASINVSQIVELAQDLGSKAVGVVPNRCVAVRNRNAHCQRCVTFCPVGAVMVGGNKIAINSMACVGCGSCTTVCPTGALIPLEPTDEKLDSEIVQAATKTDGNVVIACARMAAKRVANPDLFATVPCLSRVDETLLVSLAAHSTKAITLVSGDCAHCKHHKCQPLIDFVVESTNDLIAQCGNSVRIQRLYEFPAEVLTSNIYDSVGNDRRSFFSSTKDSVKVAALTAGGKAVDSALGRKQKPDTVRDSLKIGSDGKMSTSASARHLTLLDNLDALMQSATEPAANAIESRFFGRLVIDQEMCKNCQMCIRFCPTGAISLSEQKAAEEGASLFEFWPSECVACELCVDACFHKALALEEAVPVDELFSFEPQILHAPAPPKRAGILGR